MSPGVLIFPRDVAKVSEVRDKSLWAFFARKFDNSLQSTQLKDSLDKLSKQNSRKVWTRVQKHQVPALWRLTQVLASSFADVVSVDRLQRDLPASSNVDGLFHVQTLQLQLGHGRTTLLLREKLAMPSRSSSLLALRIGCDWNKTDLVFDGDVSAVASSSSGLYSCPSLWAIVHWQMSKKPVSEEKLLGCFLQECRAKIEHQPLLFH
eukprot:g12012.t1